MVWECRRRHQQLFRASEVELHQLKDEDEGASADVTWYFLGLDSTPRLTMLRVGIQWSEELTEIRDLVPGNPSIVTSG